MSRIATWTVGRSEDCDVVLDDGTVSRRHAEMVCLPDGRIHVADCGTTNGTFTHSAGGWRRIRQEVLRPGDLIRFGEHTMTARELRSRCVPRRQASAERAESLPRREKDLDPNRAKMRDPDTGEVIDG